MTSGRAFVGTSGWAYASWKPLFYPEGTKSAGFLAYYATRLATLEVNYTFNHLPTEKNIAGWKEATPEGFVFALKASQQITHVRQLRDPAETVPLFFERAPSPVETLGTTAPFAYARLRTRPGYSDAEVDAWAARLRPMLEAGKDVYAYFRHDETGANALSAERLRDALG